MVTYSVDQEDIEVFFLLQHPSKVRNLQQISFAHVPCLDHTTSIAARSPLSGSCAKRGLELSRSRNKKRSRVRSHCH